MSSYSQSELIVGAVLVLVTIISLICSILNIWLIYDMKLWSGYLLLVLSLALCQVTYDISFMLWPCYYQNLDCQIAMNVFSDFGGFSATLWTNVMSFVFLSVVVYFRSFDILKHYSKILVVVLSLTIAYTVANIYEFIYSSSTDDTRTGYGITNWVYYYYRMASIVFNFGVYIYSVIRLRRFLEVANYNDPIRQLIYRFQFYPLCQATSRLGFAWYEMQYGFLFSVPPQGEEPTRSAALMISVILGPLAGVGYFIIFLLVQPNAYSHLKSRWLGLCGFICGFDCTQSGIKNIDIGIAANAPADGTVEELRSSLQTQMLSEDELINHIEYQYQKRISLQSMNTRLTSVDSSMHSMSYTNDL